LLNDTVGINSNITHHDVKTKRELLKLMGSIFDPLGLLSPLTIGIRLLFRKLWQLKLEWDENIPEEILALLEKQLNLLSLHNNISIPRYIKSSVSNFDIFAFCDASAEAICCVFYGVTILNGVRIVSFVCSKARVSPLSETITIPRLELLAALLLVNVYRDIQDSLPEHQCFFYTDSMCCLSWIKGTTKTWKLHVQSRVDLIRQYTNTEHWHFVEGKDNPADIATRLIFDEHLMDRWYGGPNFIHEGTFPKQPECFIADNEAIDTKAVLLIQNNLHDPLPGILYERYSKYITLLNVVCRILRLFNRSNEILSNYSDSAEEIIIRSIQFRHLSHVYSDIVGSKKLNITTQFRLFIHNGIIYTATRIPATVASLKIIKN